MRFIALFFFINLAETDIEENSVEYEVVRSEYIACLEKTPKK